MVDLIKMSTKFIFIQYVRKVSIFIQFFEDLFNDLG